MDFLVAMLADSIEIEGDLVTLRNGAFAYVPVDAVPTSLELNLLLVLVAEADEVRDITIRCHVAGPDGTYVPGGFEALVASPEVSTLVTEKAVTRRQCFLTMNSRIEPQFPSLWCAIASGT